jgi:tetratricopeptide (TPR) repeat protein
VQVCEKAVKLQQTLADQDRAVPYHVRDLALAELRLGIAHQQADELQSAADAYGEARSLLERLLKQGNALPQYQADLARVQRQFALLYLEQKQLDRAEEAAASAIEQLNELHKRPGDAARFDDELARAYEVRARVRTKQTHFAQAVEDWDQAIARAGNKDRDWFRLHRCETRARAGDIEVALKEAEVLAPAALKNDKSGAALFELGRIYALAAVKTSTQEQYAARALEFLAKAQAVGFFRLDGNRDKLAADPDLRGLRERPDFQAWLRELPAAATARD